MAQASESYTPRQPNSSPRVKSVPATVIPNKYVIMLEKYAASLLPNILPRLPSEEWSYIPRLEIITAPNTGNIRPIAKYLILPLYLHAAESRFQNLPLLLSFRIFAAQQYQHPGSSHNSVPAAVHCPADIDNVDEKTMHMSSRMTGEEILSDALRFLFVIMLSPFRYSMHEMR